MRSSAIFSEVLRPAALAAGLFLWGSFSFGQTQTFDGYSQMRSEIMNIIGSSKTRLWIATDYLTDGDIVQGLFLAQYRKLNVQVLLGRPKVNFYMSRVNFLKSNNIPVFLKPPGFRTSPSVILADDRLVYIDAELDFRATHKRFSLTTAPAEDRPKFEADFAKAAGEAIPAHVVPVPLVGKRGGGKTYLDYSGETRWTKGPRAGSVRPPMPPANHSPEDVRDSYRYGYGERSPPPGVTKLLPKETVYQRKEQLRKAQPVPPVAPETENPKNSNAANPDTRAIPVENMSGSNSDEPDTNEAPTP